MAPWTASSLLSGARATTNMTLTPRRPILKSLSCTVPPPRAHRASFSLSRTCQHTTIVSRRHFASSAALPQHRPAFSGQSPSSTRSARLTVPPGTSLSDVADAISRAADHTHIGPIEDLRIEDVHSRAGPARVAHVLFRRNYAGHDPARRLVEASRAGTFPKIHGCRVHVSMEYDQISHTPPGPSAKQLYNQSRVVLLVCTPFSSLAFSSFASLQPSRET